jgi:type IV fimbrial biogenesis protein FimT
LSVVETLMGSTVAAVALTIVVPSFQEMTARRRVEGHAMQLSSDLQYARSEAVARNEGVVLGIRPLGAGACYVIHTGAPGECQCSAVGPTVCGAAARELKTVVLPLERQIRLQTNVAALQFNPTRGTVSPTGTLKITGPDGLAIHHVVNIMGRVRSCSPGQTMPGYKAC